jgi:ribosomal protein S18 acetylase RimI-like enzyme
MTLIYRNYRPEDAERVVFVYNRAFNESFFFKEIIDVKWKYEQNPDIRPEFFHICEDSEKGKIVGFITSTIETVRIQNQKVKMGFINHLATDPEYQNRGIGKKLMEMATNFFDSKDVKLSCLITNKKSHAREKIYIPAGFRDLSEYFISFRIISIRNMLHDIKLSILIYPILILYDFLFKLIHSFQNVHDIEQFHVIIKDKEPAPEFYNVAQEKIDQNYILFPERSFKNWQWRRELVPKQNLKPLYIMVSKNGRIIAGISITDRLADMHFWNIKVRLGIVHEYFVDKFSFATQKELNKFVDWFNKTIFSIARIRHVTALMIFSSAFDHFINNAFKRWGILSFKGGIYMIRLNSDQNSHDFSKWADQTHKPPYISTYNVMGLP